MTGVPAQDKPEQQPLGVLLVSRGLLDEEQLAAALAQQAQTGRPLGEIIVAQGYVTGALVAQALATQRGGLTRTEYGYATGFGSNEAVGMVVPPPPLTPESSDRPALR